MYTAVEKLLRKNENPTSSQTSNDTTQENQKRIFSPKQKKKNLPDEKHRKEENLSAIFPE